MTTTPRLELPLLAGGQAQKHLTMNAGLLRLESLVQAAVLSRTTTVQPASPSDGDSYILSTGATGADWASRPANTFATFDSGVWSAFDFPTGAVVYVEDENRFVIKFGGGWSNLTDSLGAIDNLAHLGIGASADSTNVLALKGPATLMSAQYAASGGSGDISLALNKEADGGTAQILLQKDYSTRAVLGLLGDDNLTLKISPDGVSFTSALTIDRTSGRISLTQTATTASAANVYLDGSNVLYKSTSSGRYKTEIEDVLSGKAEALMAVRPKWYRSLAPADDPRHSWYGFIAEEVGVIDPRLVTWIDDDAGGKIPDGVAYDRFVVIHQHVLRDLLGRVAVLEARLA